VGFWDGEVGEGIGGAGVRGDGQFGVDVVAVGVLCWCLRIWGWVLVNKRGDGWIYVCILDKVPDEKSLDGEADFL